MAASVEELRSNLEKCILDEIGKFLKIPIRSK